MHQTNELWAVGFASSKWSGMMKSTPGMIVVVAMALLLLGVPSRPSAAQGPPYVESWTYTETHAKILERGDISSASHVIGTLQRKLRAAGPTAVSAAVPGAMVLFERLNSNLSPRGEVATEGEGELLGQVLSFLSVLGDARAEPVLLAGMRYAKTSQGLLSIGHSVIPAILDSVSNVDNAAPARFGAMYTLRKMHARDETFFTESEKGAIRAALESALVAGEAVRISAASCLGVFGDESTIPKLHEAVRNVPYQAKGHGVRWYADEAIREIQSRQ